MTALDSPEQSFLELKKGDEFYGDIITHIYHVTDTHIIYSIDKFDIQYAENNPPGDISCLYRLLKSFRRLSREIDKKRFVFSITSVMNNCLKGNIEKSEENANSLLTDIQNYIKNLQNGRRIYLGTYTILISIFWIVAIIQNLLSFSNGFTNSSSFVLTGLFGATGGFLTVVYRLNSIDFNFEYSKWGFCLMSFSRLAIALFSGMILYILIKSNIAFGFLNDIANKNYYVYLVFAILAGFSEAFIPNVLNSLDQKTK